jgi:cytochrome c oxidase subunit 1
MTVKVSLTEKLAALPSSDRALLKGLIGVALATFVLGVGFGALTALIRAGTIALDPETGYRLMTLHGVNIFFYWLYFAQTALLLAFAAVYSDGGGRLALAPVAWLGFVLMIAGFAASVAGALTGTPLLYDGAPELAVEDRAAAGLFYAGYLLLALGLFLASGAAIATALAPKFLGRIAAWSSVGFGTVAWAGLVMVSAVAAANAFLPAALWAFGWAPLPADHSTGWHILFHNLHYLPLMGTVLVWYVLVRELTGVTSVFGDRFSKIVFSLYLIFVPPTSLYHMFLEPGLSAPVRALGSLLSLFIGVPTVAMFLVIVVSLEAHARAHGARGLFGWMARLPWRDPAMAAAGMAVINLALGGTFAFVLIQERLATLLSDTFFVPGVFHFFTVGAVSLTLLAGLTRVIPALTGYALPARRLLRHLPYAVTLGLVIFGAAGVGAGLSGMPRRALDVAYEGAAPAAWSWLSSAIGAGGTIMAVALLLYGAVLLAALLAPAARAVPAEGGHLTAFTGSGAVVHQAAWTGPLSVAILIAAMYMATIVAFKLMQALPILAQGGGH